LEIIEISKFQSNTVQDKPMDASVPKMNSICSAIFVQCRLVTEIGWSWVARDHPGPKVGENSAVQ